MKLQNEKGFTLLEILIVGVIISILAAITLPRMDMVFGTNRLATSTSEVTSTLYTARMKAVNDSQGFGVQFEEDGTFQLVRDPFGVNEVFGPTHSLELGVTFIDINFNNWLAVFTSFGQLDKSSLGEGDLIGSVYMSNADGDTTVVDVTLVTGRIKETNL